MGIQRSQEDSWTQEMRKWEHRPVLVNGTYIEPLEIEKGGKKDFPHQEYPKAMYRAERADGGPRICDFQIAQSEGHQQLMESQGWHARQEDAIAGIHAQDLEFAKLAANRAHTERWMSPKAQAEAQAIDEATIQHVPEIPRTPIKKRGRPVKMGDE